MQSRNTNELGMSSSEFSTARSYLFSFLRYTGEKAWVSLSMMVLLGLSEGVGLIMLIPFLQFLGFDRGQVVEAGAWKWLAQKKDGRFRKLLEQQH